MLFSRGKASRVTAVAVGIIQPKLLQHRNLNVHEYSGMELLAKHGVPVPENQLCKVSIYCSVLT